MPSFPKTIWVAPTSRCNARCRTCHHHSADFGQDMPERVLERVVSEVLPHTSRVNLVGLGEPLLAKRIDTLLEACQRHGARPFLITNTLLLRPELIESLVRLGAEVMVSLDGATAATFESIRQGVRFDHVLKTLGRIREAMLRHPESGFKLLSNTVVMRRNIPELPDIVRILLEHGVDTISLSDLIPYHVAPELAEEVPARHLAELRESFARADALARAAGVRIATPTYYRAQTGEQNPDGACAPARQTPGGDAPGQAALQAGAQAVDRSFLFPQRCLLPWTHTNILESGIVTPCCASSLRLGDLTRQSFTEIWNGPRYRHLRRQMLTNNPDSQCKRCNLHGGLSAGDPLYFRRFLEGGISARLDLRGPLVRFTGGAWALGQHPAVDITGQATARLSLPAADYLALSLKASPSDPCLASISLAGGPPEWFDSSDDAAVFDMRGLSGEVDITIQTAPIDPGEAEGATPPTLTLLEFLTLSASGLGEKASSQRSRATRAEHGEVIAALADSLRKRLPAGGSFAVTGIVDIGEELVRQLAGSGLRFAGYYDHHAGHVRQHAIRPFSAMRPGQPDALVLASPYHPERSARVLTALCARTGAGLVLPPRRESA